MTDKELDEILNEIKKRSESAKNNVEEKKMVDNIVEPVVEHTADEPKLPTNEEVEQFVPKQEKPELKIDFEPEEIPIQKAVSNLELEQQPTPSQNEQEPVDEELDITSAAPDETALELEDSAEPPKKKSKKPLIIAIVIVIIVALAAGIYFGFFYNNDTTEPTTTKAAAVEETAETDLGPLNPLTGETGYNADAVGKRPVAVVVENEYSTESVRPQWGIADADIVLEGESEYSTRLLLFWADYTTVPEQVGPTRSARPPFIRFSQLFDSVFIHAGLSHSRDSYVGADTVFETDNVDHINLLSYSEDGTYFGRDYDRTSTVEHTGFLNGTNLAKLIEEKGFDTQIDESKFTTLKFNTEATAISQNAATKINFNWSDVYSTGKCPKTGHFTFNEEGGYYTTTDFDSDYGTADLQFENLIFLLDETEYVVKENYKGSGSSETYCNYNLTGGKGVVASEGTYVDITWGVDDGKLWLKDTEGNEIALNPGKSYIGYGSSNHGGTITINPDETE